MRSQYNAVVTMAQLKKDMLTLQQQRNQQLLTQHAKQEICFVVSAEQWAQIKNCHQNHENKDLRFNLCLDFYNNLNRWTDNGNYFIEMMWLKKTDQTSNQSLLCTATWMWFTGLKMVQEPLRQPVQGRERSGWHVIGFWGVWGITWAWDPFSIR